MHDDEVVLGDDALDRELEEWERPEEFGEARLVRVPTVRIARVVLAQVAVDNPRGRPGLALLEDETVDDRDAVLHIIDGLIARNRVRHALSDAN